MKKLLILIVILSVAFVSCPDPSSSGENPREPGGGTLTTEEVQAAAAFSMIAFKMLSEDFQRFGPNPQFYYDIDQDCYVLNSCDVSCYDFNTLNAGTVNGSVTEQNDPNYGALMAYDLALTGLPFSALSFRADINVEENLDVTIDGTVYNVPFPDLDSVIPDPNDVPPEELLAYFSGDARSSASSRGPGGMSIGGTASNGGIAALEAISSAYSISGVNDYQGESWQFPYSGSAYGSVSSAGALSVNSRIEAKGNGLIYRDTYESYARANKTYYLSASSSDPDTARITISAEMSASGSLSYHSSDSQMDVFSKIQWEIIASRLGWMTQPEMGELEVGWMDPSLERETSLGYLGWFGADRAATDSGFFDGKLNEAAENEGTFSATLTGTGDFEFYVEPGWLVGMNSCLWIWTKTEFNGDFDEPSEAWAEGDFSAEECTFTGTDPDNPDAVITVTVHQVEE